MSAPTIRECIRIVSERTGVPISALRGPDRCRRISRPRQVAMWLAREHRYSLLEIGAVFARDHSTVLHGIEAVRKLRETDGEIATICDELKPQVAREWSPVVVPVRRADLMAAAAGI